MCAHAHPRFAPFYIHPDHRKHVLPCHLPLSQFIFKCRQADFHSNLVDPGPGGGPTVTSEACAKQTRYTNVKVERSISLTSGEPPYPPLFGVLTLLYIAASHATSVRDSIHIPGQPAQQQRSQLTRVVDLPLCLPFAVIVTLLDVSLEQDAHLPLRA